MNRIHRTLFLDLLRGGATALCAILTVWFLVALALLVGSSRSAGAPFMVLLRFTAWEAVATLWLTLPLSTLTAALFVFGRVRADREATAMTVAGLSPLQILMPAIAFGALIAGGLALLQQELMPAAKFRSRLQHDDGIGAHLETLLRRSQRSIVDQRFSVSWEHLRERGGRLELEGLHLLVLDDARAVQQSIEAELAIPTVDLGLGQLRMDLEGAVVRPRGAEPLLADRLSWPLDLDELGVPYRQKKLPYQSTAEVLVSEWRASRTLLRKDLSPEEKQTATKALREAKLERFGRLAHAISAFVCAVLGGLLGLRFGTSNRAIIFLVGFLLLAAVHHPLGLLGEALAKGGVLPPEIARSLGSVVLLGVALACYRKLLRA